MIDPATVAAAAERRRANDYRSDWTGVDLRDRDARLLADAYVQALAARPLPTVRQHHGRWVAYYANGCPVMDEEGIPIGWATEEDAWKVAGGKPTTSLAAWRAVAERLAEAALLFRRSACRPADDGKYDDLYDTARDSLIDAIADFRRLAGKETP